MGKRYYIMAPAKKVSGGPELAHQLCSELLGAGYQAWMYYFIDGKKEPVDELADIRYEKYGTSHVKDIEEVEAEESIVIILETCGLWALVLNKCKKVLWWMSVDNYIKNMEYAIGRDCLKEIEFQVSLHLVQSYYAYQYLLKRGISSEKILCVSDYIGENYGKVQIPVTFRRDIALYNPIKGLEEIEPLFAKTSWLNWIPLYNLTEEQMITIMGVAKIYVDFGPHPGKDRIPREAASCGCCIITNRKGSAAFYEDVPIPDCYKIDNVSMEYARIEGLLKDICIHWEEHNKQFDEYRKFISLERQKFSADVRKFVGVIENG